ncbi:hypothetical protein GCM10009663_15530 [Kitasatospora arboriphila]|uniref:Uncharacterized protein n=1 Tax=Kitasatospora arboriphila TaxID=258052 RepID=A0ABP4DWH2_9ACTN
MIGHMPIALYGGCAARGTRSTVRARAGDHDDQESCMAAHHPSAAPPSGVPSGGGLRPTGRR